MFTKRIFPRNTWYYWRLSRQFLYTISTKTFQIKFCITTCYYLSKRLLSTCGALLWVRQVGRIPRIASNWTYALHMYTHTHTGHTCTHTHMCTVRLKVWYHFRYFLSLYEQTTGITEIHVYNTHTWYSYTCDNYSGNKTDITFSQWLLWLSHYL